MKTISWSRSRLWAPLLASTVACIVLAAVLAVSASAEPKGKTTTITFQEQESGKGSSFKFIDNAPKSKLRHGFPAKISAGDEFVFQNPDFAEGKRIGRTQVVCVATKAARRFDKADFQCEGTFVFSNGTLAVSAIAGSGSKTEGAVTGGTGVYAAARGTFASVETGKVSNVTVTLYE